MTPTCTHNIAKDSPLGVPHDATVNFLVNHGRNHPRLQFWAQQYKCWRFTWCFMSLAHNLKCLRKWQWKARTPFFNSQMSGFAFFSAFIHEKLPKKPVTLCWCHLQWNRETRDSYGASLGCSLGRVCLSSQILSWTSANIRER